MSEVVLQDINKYFDDFQVLRDISFDVKQGEFLTLLGPSGCGKSTLLKIISGFLRPDTGHLYIDDKLSNDILPEKRNTAMCFQSYALFPHMSVKKNIGYGLKMRKTEHRKMEKEVQKAIDAVNLADHVHKMPNELSGGQQQRVALARALAVKPDVILFDEPLSNLDAKLRDSVRDEIKQLQKNYCLTSIYVTHDQSEALAMSDKIVVMNQGKIEQVGSPKDIYFQPKNRFVANFIGSANVMAVEILQSDDHGYMTESSLGRLRISGNKAPSYKKTYAMWRPESAVMVMPSEDASLVTGHNQVSLKLEKVTFLGNLYDLYLTDKSGACFRMQTMNFPMVETGEWLTINIPADALVFLDEPQEEK